MADVEKILDSNLENVSGGQGDYRQYSKGKVEDHGNYVVYTIAPGDALSGIAIRFGVSMAEIQQWNNIPNKDVIYAGQKLVIYPR